MRRVDLSHKPTVTKSIRCTDWISCRERKVNAMGELEWCVKQLWDLSQVRFSGTVHISMELGRVSGIQIKEHPGEEKIADSENRPLTSS